MPYGNNMYPATYQSPLQQYSYNTPSPPMSYQAPMMSQMPVNNSSSGLTWVQGEIGAKAYPVAPGMSVILMDSEDERFYIKSTDASGMPLPLRTFSYTEEVNVQHSYDQQPQQIDTSQFITRSELEDMLNERMPMQNTKRGKVNGESSV